MLKNLGISGTFFDENLSVDIMLENPAKYDLAPSALLFSVTTKSKDATITDINPEDFTFYIMDETQHMYHTHRIVFPFDKKVPLNQGHGYRSHWMICTDFLHEFLFQELRVAFYHRAYKDIVIIKLQY